MKRSELLTLTCHYCGSRFRRRASRVTQGQAAGKAPVFCGRNCSDVGQYTYDRGAVFDFLVNYARQYTGLSPSYREIGEAFGITSPSVVKNILDDLAERGQIILPRKGQGRGIQIVGAEWVFKGVTDVD